MFNLKPLKMRQLKEISLKILVGTVTAFIIAAVILLFANVVELGAALN